VRNNNRDEKASKNNDKTCGERDDRDGKIKK
jgi:hypothetical protein